MDTDRPYLCNDCMKSFKLKWHLKTHMQTCKGKEREFRPTCDKCERRFCSKRTLALNVKSNLLVENVATNLPVRFILQNTEWQFMKESNFLEKQCGKEFTRQGNLAQQRRTAHEGVKFPCGQCGKGFTTHGVLAIDRRAVHERVKFPCGQCGKELTDQGNLSRHRRTVHEGVKYPCGQCSKEFTSQEYLAKHKRAVHEGQEELFN